MEQCFASIWVLGISALPNVPNIYEQSPRGKRESFWLVLGTLKVLKVCSFQDPSWLKRYILYVFAGLSPAAEITFSALVLYSFCNLRCKITKNFWNTQEKFTIIAILIKILLEFTKKITKNFWNMQEKLAFICYFNKFYEGFVHKAKKCQKYKKEQNVGLRHAKICKNHKKSKIKVIIIVVFFGRLKKKQYLCEKFRNEKNRNMENPFKFGTIVEENYFTDRVQEVAYIKQFINSPNHLILISPRRFGKSSVVMRALKESGRKSIVLNLQKVISTNDLSANLLRELFKVRPIEQIKHFFTHFRFIPTISANPLTGSIDVSFQPDVNTAEVLEDVMQLLDKVSESLHLVVVLDEFQEILDIAPKLDKQLRSIMQQQKHINYILLGSQESMMTDIFEKKKSPFYHFGELMRLRKLPYDDFEMYLSSRLQSCFPDTAHDLAKQILDYTQCHPYYGQQLAFHIWQLGMLHCESNDILATAVEQIVETHNLDYERLWFSLNRTCKWILQRLAMGRPLQTNEYRTSTIYSALKKLQREGFVIYTSQFEIEDPYFKYYIEHNAV